MHDRTAGGLRAVRPTPDTLAGVIAYALEHRLQVGFRPLPAAGIGTILVEASVDVPDVPGEPQRMGNQQAIDWADVLEHRSHLLRIMLVRAIFELEDQIAARNGTVHTEGSDDDV